MVLRANRRAVFCLSLSFCLSGFFLRLLAQGFPSDWPRIHQEDLAKWAAKSGLSFQLLDGLTKAATRDDAKDVEEGYFWYLIENVDTKTLREHQLILLSTWGNGTGHCMTLYVLTRHGSGFQKIWESSENLCTESVLGAAKSQAMPDGRIVVRFREHSKNFDPEKEEAPAVLEVTITYKWDGSTFNFSRTERPATSR